MPWGVSDRQSSAERAWRTVLVGRCESANEGALGRRLKWKYTHRDTLHAVLAEQGFEWVNCMRIDSGCTTRLTSSDLPAGRLVVRLSRHYAAVIDGVIHDTHDCSRGGSRCVYGYWRQQG